MKLLPAFVYTSLSAADETIGMIDDVVNGSRHLTKLYKAEMEDNADQVNHDIELRRIARAKELAAAQADAPEVEVVTEVQS